VRSLFVLLVLLPATSFAGRLKVPVDVGIGPAGYWFFGPLMDNRGATPHFGLKLNVYAVIDDEYIESHRNEIPPKYVKMAEGITEVRITPSFLIPDSLIISPKIDSPNFGSTGIYGITWRPLSIGFPLTGRKKPGAWKKSSGHLDLRLGLIFTYAYIYSDFPTIPTTHFVRPGLDFMLEMEVAASSSFLISLGYAQQVYLPQKLGEFGFGPLDQSIFLVGQGFLKFHFRFPYEVSI
jgi:hypothetical protein